MKCRGCIEKNTFLSCGYQVNVYHAKHTEVQEVFVMAAMDCRLICWYKSLHCLLSSSYWLSFEKPLGDDHWVTGLWQPFKFHPVGSPFLQWSVSPCNIMTTSGSVVIPEATLGKVAFKVRLLLLITPRLWHLPTEDMTSMTGPGLSPLIQQTDVPLGPPWGSSDFMGSPHCFLLVGHLDPGS
jgi:hypothetical protein